MLNTETSGKKHMVVPKAVECSQGTDFTFAVKFLYYARQITCDLKI